MSADPRRRAAPLPPPPPPPPPAEPDSTKVELNSKDERSSTPQSVDQAHGQEKEGGYKLKFCTVCASNNNR